MKAVHEDLIRRRAHELWEQSGRPHGREKEHWEQAEIELLNAAPAIAAGAAAKPARKRGAEAGAAEPGKRRPGRQAGAKTDTRPSAGGETPRTR